MTDQVSEMGFQEAAQAVDWAHVRRSVDDRGFGVIPGLLSPAHCSQIRAAFESDKLFRSHIVMQRHGYGQGEYKYFAYPLPDLIQELRWRLYQELVPLANQWAERLNSGIGYPGQLEQFLSTCHEQAQTRPTPLVLRYGPGDYNRLHQDLYGGMYFPVQAAILLDQPGRDFAGGEFVLTEQKARSQSRPQVVPLAQGDAVIFAVNHRPAQGVRGYHRLTMRHGVSEIRSGQRHTLGIIFHDAS